MARYDRIKLFEEMERRFESKNEQYFKDLLGHQDNVVRTRAVCILADVAGENAVKPIGKVLKDDEDALVRHEAAFSLGQLGTAIKVCLMQLPHLSTVVFSSLNDVAACRVINYHHIIRVEREHLMISRI